MTLEQTRAEMRAIIQNLENIAAGVRSDFDGIGQDMCANSIEAVASYYRHTVLRVLNGMDQNLLSRILNGEE